MIFNAQKYSTLNLIPNMNSLINIILRSNEILIKLDASNIVPEEVSKKKTKKQTYAIIFAMTLHTFLVFHITFSTYAEANKY